MSEPPIDPWTVPLLLRVHELDELLFPKLLRRVAALQASSRVAPQGSPPCLRKAEVILARLHSVRSHTALQRWLLSRSLKEICSIHWYVTNFVIELDSMPRDCLAWDHAKHLLGRNPTPLRLLRAALKFYIDA